MSEGAGISVRKYMKTMIIYLHAAHTSIFVDFHKDLVVKIFVQLSHSCKTKIVFDFS